MKQPVAHLSNFYEPHSAMPESRPYFLAKNIKKFLKIISEEAACLKNIVQSIVDDFDQTKFCNAVSNSIGNLCKMLFYDGSCFALS